MSELSKQELHELTEAICDRLKEFDSLTMALPTKGMVRIAYEVITSRLRSKEIVSVILSGETKRKPPEPPKEDRPRALDKSVPVASLEANHVAATLGPEHVLVTPLQANGRTLEEADRDFMALGLNSAEKSALLRDIIAELQMLSDGGEMPTMAKWDKRKPPTLPSAQAVVARYKLTWGELAGYARLKYEGRRAKVEAQP